MRRYTWRLVSVMGSWARSLICIAAQRGVEHEATRQDALAGVRVSIVCVLSFFCS